MTSTQNDVSTPTIAVVGFLGTVLLFALIVLLVVIYYRVQTGEEFVKDVSQPPVEVSQLAARQRANLAEYRLLDKEKQVYAIPIGRAMARVVARRRADPEGPPGTDATGPSAAAAATEPSGQR